MVASDFSFEFVRTIPAGLAESVPNVDETTVVWQTIKATEVPQSGLVLLAIGADMPFELGMWVHPEGVSVAPAASWVVLATGTLVNGDPTTLTFHYAGSRIYVRTTATTTDPIDIYASVVVAGADPMDASAGSLASIDAKLLRMDSVLGAAELHLSSMDTLAAGAATWLKQDTISAWLQDIDTIEGAARDHLHNIDSVLGAAELHLSSMDTLLGAINDHVHSIDSISGAAEIHLTSIDSISGAAEVHLGSLDAKAVQEVAVTPIDVGEANAALPAQVSRLEGWLGTVLAKWHRLTAGIQVATAPTAEDALGMQNQIPMGKYTATDPVLTEGQLYPLLVNAGGWLKSVLPNYDSASGANKVLDIAPMNMQLFDYSIVTTNQATQNYPSDSGASTEGYSDFSWTGVIANPDSTMTLILQVSNVGGATSTDWMTIKFYDNMAGAVAASTTASSSTTYFANSVDKLGAYKYWRLGLTAGDATNTVQIYVHGKPI